MKMIKNIRPILTAALLLAVSMSSARQSDPEPVAFKQISTGLYEMVHEQELMSVITEFC